MVFETIYSLYEKEVVNEIKKLKTDEEIKFCVEKVGKSIKCGCIQKWKDRGCTCGGMRRGRLF